MNHINKYCFNHTGGTGMFKKIAMASVLGLTAMTFVFGAGTWSYLKTCGNSVREAVKREVPIEFEVSRAKRMVEDLMPEIRHSMHVIAEQQVEVEHLTKQIAERESRLAEQEATILSMRSDLDDTEQVSFRYGRVNYTKAEVEKDLDRRFKRFVSASESLKSDQQILSARQKTLEANREKLENMLSSKRDLEVQIAQLEARFKAVQAAETVSQLAIDDSELNRAKTLIRDLNKQLDVKEKLMDNEGEFAGLIPADDVNELPTGDVLEEIDTYFKTKATKNVSLAELK